MKILEDVPLTAVEYEPVLPPEERAAAVQAIQRRREERSRRDLEAGRHPSQVGLFLAASEAGA